MKAIITKLRDVDSFYLMTTVDLRVLVARYPYPKWVGNSTSTTTYTMYDDVLYRLHTPSSAHSYGELSRIDGYVRRVILSEGEEGWESFRDRVWSRLPEVLMEDVL